MDTKHKIKQMCGTMGVTPIRYYRVIYIIPGGGKHQVTGVVHRVTDHSVHIKNGKYQNWATEIQFDAIWDVVEVEPKVTVNNQTFMIKRSE